MPPGVEGASEGDRARRRRRLVTLALLAFSLMLFQIAILRELRFQLNTLFTLTPFLFSLVIILIGAGAIAARWVKRSIQVLRATVSLLPLLVIPAFVLTMVVAESTVDHSATSAFFEAPLVGGGQGHLSSVVWAFLLSALLGYGLVFFLQGCTFALYFREGRSEGGLSKVYAVDLIASGCGALLGGVLSYFFSPIHLALGASLVLALNLWVSGRTLALRRGLVLLETVVVVAVVVLEVAAGMLSHLERPSWLGAPPTFSVWTPYRRIDAIEKPGGLYVFADGILFQMYRRGPNAHGWDINRVATARLLAARPPEQRRSLLVIGSGTGTDVRILRELGFRDLEITAVELDPGFVKTAQRFPWLWREYRTARIVVGEGRYFLESTRRKYDVVLFAYVDPQSAVASIGLPDANFLYTDAGLRAALRRVKHGGILSITRIYFAKQERRFVQRLCATLQAAGIPRENVGLYRNPGSVPWGYYGRLGTLRLLVGKGTRPPDIRGQIGVVPLRCEPGGRPTTDQYPMSIETGVWFHRLGSQLGQSWLGMALVILVGVALLWRLTTSVGHLSFFLLGFGSFLVESLVLYQSFLLLGNPSLSAALAVAVLLILSGVGSALSERLERQRWFLPLVPIAVLAYALTAPLLNASMLGSAVWLRALLFVLHAAIPAVLVGAMFPVGLRRFRTAEVPSMFFIDLVGCALAPLAFWMALSTWGVHAVSAGSCVSYACVALIFGLRKR